MSLEKLNNSLYVFIGPPGSGKGSLSSLCVKRLGWLQLSTGNLCRAEIKSESSIGKQIDFILKSGKLVSDELIAQMVETALERYLCFNVPIILDGFPRTVFQAQELDRLFLKNVFTSLKLFIVRLDVLDDTVITRLANRVLCPNELCQAVYSVKELALGPRCQMKCDSCEMMLVRRDDDKEDIVRERLGNYRFHERSLVSYYEQRPYKLCSLQVERPLEDIFNEFRRILGV